jgi:hypothetical protein
MMTDEQIAEIESRLNATTEGPWFFHPPLVRRDGTVVEKESTCVGDFFIAYGVEGDDSENYDLLEHYEEADYRFMAEAKQDIPALLGEVHRLRALLAER